MQFSNLLKLCVLFIVATLYACSSDEKASTNKVINIKSIVIPQTKGTIVNNPVQLPGIRVYTDPVTGEFMDHVPQNDSDQEKTVSNSTTTTEKTTKAKTPLQGRQSTHPDGGEYIYIPDPWRTNNKN